MLGQSWRASRRIAPAAGAWRTRVMTLGLGGGLFAHLLFGLTDSGIMSNKPGVVFWLLLGLIVGWFEQTRRGRLVDD